MKNRVKAALLGGGALVGLASLVPLTTYADNPDTLTVTAIVNPVIQLDLSIGAEGVNMSGEAGEVLEPGIIGAKVTANTRYNIDFKTTSSDTDMKGATSGGVIPALKEGAEFVEGVNAWAMRGPNTPANTYVRIGNTGTTLFTSEGTDDGSTIHNFEFWISTNQNLAADSYSINLTVTASPATP